MQKYSGKKSPKAFSSIAVRSQSDSHKDLPITSSLSVDLLKNLKKKPVETDAYLYRNHTLENATYEGINDVNKRISSETSIPNKVLNQVLPLAISNTREEGYGFLRAAQSPKLSQKLERNFSLNNDLSKSIINGSQKAISDAIIKADGKDLQTELQLGELTLYNLDKKLSKCIEHSRRTLSLTEVYSQKANSVLTPDKRSLFMDSSIPSPARKNSGDSGFGRKLSHSNSSSLSVAKKASDVSMRSLAMTRETTGEEALMPSLEVKDSSIRIRSFESKAVPVRELTKSDASQTIFASNIVPRSRVKAEYIEASRRNLEQDFVKNKATPSNEEIKRGRNSGQDMDAVIIKNRIIREKDLFTNGNALPPTPEIFNKSLEELNPNEPILSSASDLNQSQKLPIRSGVKKAVLQSLKNQSTVGDESPFVENSLTGMSTAENMLFNQSFEQNQKSGSLAVLKTNTLNQSRSQDGLDGSLAKSQDIDIQFVKAFSLVKTKVVNQGSNFDERMKSDIFFRQRFDDDLLEFKKSIQPKMSEEKATELYAKLVEDGKKRALKSRQIEKQKEIVRQERAKSFYELLSLQTDDEHQKVFERLVGDSKERAKEKEKRELERKQKLENEENELLNLSHQQKSNPRLWDILLILQKIERMDKQSVQKLVNKLVKDAERRKLSTEKTELLKAEEENKSMTMIVRQKSPERHKQVESKVKQYINRAIERNVHIRQRSIKKYENIVVPTKTPTTVTPKKMRCNTEQMLLKNVPQKTVIVPIPTPVPVLEKEEEEQPLVPVVKKEQMNSFEAALNKEIKEMKESCMKEAWKANIDYLRGLRGDIEKIKDNIEQKIEDIERGNFAWPENQNTHEQILKHSRSQNNSLERTPEKVSQPKSRVRNQSITIDPSQKKREVHQNHRKVPRATSSANNFFKEQDSNTNSSIFMTDQKAQSYVTQLIKDFREIHHIKPNLRRSQQQTNKF